MRKVGILPPLTYQMQNDGEIEPAHQAYQDYDPRPREFAGQRPRNSRGQRCDLCGLTHGTSFELITRICELVFRRKLRPSFKDTKQSFSMTAGSPRATRVGRQGPFTASLLGFLKDVLTEVMTYSLLRSVKKVSLLCPLS